MPEPSRAVESLSPHPLCRNPMGARRECVLPIGHAGECVTCWRCGGADPDCSEAMHKTRRELHDLTPRELLVAIRLASGATNREIAQEVGISVKTIDTHRANVLKKLRLRNNSDITRWAIRSGYVTP